MSSRYPGARAAWKAKQRVGRYVPNAAVKAAIAGFTASARAPRNRAPKGAIRKGRELKYVDVAAAAYVADTTGTVTLLNGIAVGDDNTTRDGRQVVIKSVQVRGKLVPVDAATNPVKARIIIFWDNATVAGTPTIAAVLSAATANSFPLVNNQNRFTILVDRSYVIGGFDTTATQTYAMCPTVQDVEIYKPIGSITQYNGTGATDASIANGGLYMITIGDQAAGVGGSFTLATRVRFTDN